MKINYVRDIIVFIVTSFIVLIGLVIVVKDFLVSVAFLSVYIAVTSFVLGIQAKYLAEDTDDRINEIANTLFHTIISSFEDRRLNIQMNPNMHQIFLWKARVDLDKAKKITTGKCIIDKDSYDTLMARFNGLIDMVIKIKGILLCESLNNIMDIYDRMFVIVPDREDLKEESRIKFRKILDLDDSVIVDDKLFKTIKKSTQDKKKRWKKLSIYKSQIMEEIKRKENRKG